MGVSKEDLLVERLKAHLRRAMKERQNNTIVALRTMLSAIDNAGAVEVDKSFVPLEGVTKDVPRRELSEGQILELLQSEANERRSAMTKYEQLGKQEEAARLRAELEVFTHYLEDATG